MDNFEKAYIKSIQLTNKNGGLNEGLSSSIVKLGMKAATQAGKKIAQKSGKKVTQKTSSKVAGKTTEKIIEKTTSKAISNQAAKFVKKITESMNKAKIYKMLNKKHYVRMLVSSNFLDNNTEDFKTAFELLTDYIKGNYKSTPWTIIALIGAFVAYVLLPEEYGKLADDSDVINIIIKETINKCKSELEKYKSWKLQHPQEASLLEKDEPIIAEFGNNQNLLEKNLISETFLIAHYILFESAETDEEKLKELEKIDKNAANQISQSIKNNGSTKLNLSDKELKFLSQGQKQNLNIESFKNKKKPDQTSAKKILEQESWFMSIMKEIFSKETLVSLIPFSQKPTLDDLGQFFLCMKNYISGEYDLSEPEYDALLGIGCDLGFATLNLALGGAAAFATFGLSTIITIIGCAVTLGYICDNMTIIGRIYKKRKSENNMKLKDEEAIA